MEATQFGISEMWRPSIDVPATASGVQTTRTQMLQQEMRGIDCSDVDDEELELLSITLAASRLVEESQVVRRSRFFLLLACVLSEFIYYSVVHWQPEL